MRRPASGETEGEVFQGEGTTDNRQKAGLSITTSIKSFQGPCRLRCISGLHRFSACVSSLFIMFSCPPEPLKLHYKIFVPFLNLMPSVSCLSSWTQNWFILLKEAILLEDLVQISPLLWRSSLSYSQHCLEGMFLHHSSLKLTSLLNKNVLPIYVGWSPGQRQGWVPLVVKYTQNCHTLFFPFIADQ